MIFGRKKRMVDIRELQRRGVVRIPRQNIVIPTDKNGFIELEANTKPTSTSRNQTESSSSTNAMDFLGNSSAYTIPLSSGNRSESERITALDNKIYKLEQRIELLEKKLDVNQPSEPNLGVMGW